MLQKSKIHNTEKEMWIMNSRLKWSGKVTKGNCSTSRHPLAQGWQMSEIVEILDTSVNAGHIKVA